MSLRRAPRTVSEVIDWIEERLRRLDADRRVEDRGTSDHGSLSGLADDDHTQYQKESEKGIVNGYASLDATTKVPTGQLGNGTADATKVLRGDRTWGTPAAGAGGHIIQDEGVDLTQRARMNFVGTGVSAADSGGVTVVTVTAGTAGHTVKEDGTPLTQRAGLNFAAGLVAIDDAGNNETDVDLDYGTPSIGLGTAAAAGASNQVIRADGTIVAFDVTVPVTQAFGDAAATGAAAVAARRDHKHGMPATPQAYATVEDEGTPLTQRSTLNFVGAGVSAADSGGKTVVTIAGGSGDLFLAWTAL